MFKGLASNTHAQRMRDQKSENEKYVLKEFQYSNQVDIDELGSAHSISRGFYNTAIGCECLLTFANAYVNSSDCYSKCSTTNKHVCLRMSYRHF